MDISIRDENPDIPDTLKTCGFIKVILNGKPLYGLFYFCTYTKRLKLSVLIGTKYTSIQYTEGIEFMTFDNEVKEVDRRMIIYSILNDPSTQGEVIDDNQLIVYKSDLVETKAESLFNLESNNLTHSRHESINNQRIGKNKKVDNQNKIVPLVREPKVNLMIPINIGDKYDATNRASDEYLKQYINELIEISKSLINKDGKGKTKIEIDINRLIWAMNQIIPASLPLLPKGTYNGTILARELCVYSKDGNNYLVDC